MPNTLLLFYQLTNIIWGEASESDDHIVPYPEGSEEKPLVTFGGHSKKQWNQEVKTAEEKTLGTKNDVHVYKLESSSHFDTNKGLSASGYVRDSWPDSPLQNAACIKAYADRNCHDSLGTEVSNDLIDMTDINSERDETALVDNDPLFIQKELEDKGQSDFLHYDWADLGSFDDLDRIFRNDDPIFGNADELWSSSTDVINSPEKSFPLSAGSPSSGLGALRNTSEHYEIKTEFVPHEDQSLTPLYGRPNGPTSHGLQNVHASEDEIARKRFCSSFDPLAECPGGKSKPLHNEKSVCMIGKTAALDSHIARGNSATQNKLADKVQVNRQRKLLKRPKKAEENSEGKVLHNLCGTWSPNANKCQQFNQFSTSTIQNFPSSVLSQQRQLGGPESLRYLHASHPFLPTTYGHHYPVMPLLLHFHSEKDMHQPVVSGYELSPGSLKHENPLEKSPDSPAKPLTMTPQEKIEKLRRRQQMQAMLAIQKQQQQFSHEVTCTDHSATQMCPQENQSQMTEATNIEVEENLCMPPFLEPNLPVEQDDSNMISVMTDDCSLEEIMLGQIQDVIGKLDIGVRLCIRDSLLRLAQSAMQRHSSSTSSSNKSIKDENEVIGNEEINSHNRYARIPDAETETNAIDRTVAHLLFHRPLEPSAKQEIPESSVSIKLPCEPKITGLCESSTQNLSHQGSLAEPQHGDQYLYINTSENASNNNPDDGGVMDVEASQ
ncbi:hypothetical protein HHK36_011707 [Tetracentron sinense]|uniref:Protein LNK2 n=1 Tax=Tetracentron sinense TaxID=13715 RepID=A0A835DHG5_TETSI|nr:hypothetical protein HHK36_011707 [Tetracentron sinense]